MAEIKGFGLIICVLMVLMAFLKQMIPRGKMNHLMKAIVSIFILLSIVEGVLNFDFTVVSDLVSYTYTENEEIWNNAAEMVSKGLQREFRQYLSDENINAEVISVGVDGGEMGFSIKNITISGNDAYTARNLLSARYQVHVEIIEVINE